jgi:phosphate transport system ATP-binding protein
LTNQGEQPEARDGQNDGARTGLDHEIERLAAGGTAPEIRAELESRLEAEETKLAAKGLNFFYGNFQALKEITLAIPAQNITALIGPSGCGKSTLIRVFNRMYDLVPGTRVEGSVTIDGVETTGDDIDPIALRQRVGMVFQKPNPFPMSIYDNVAYGPRILGQKQGLDDVVENSLRSAALWDEVQDRLHRSALSLSGGQQQRLVIARVIAVEPEVILMDEPASALDPIATLKIEDLMQQLKQQYTIVVVTHNMQQAARVSDYTAFLMMNPARYGELVEFGPTAEIFNRPKDPRTEDYITGRFG